MTWLLAAVATLALIAGAVLAVCELIGLGPFACTQERNCICGDCAHSYYCSKCKLRTFGCSHDERFASEWEVEYPW